jgi:hypothetical protein
MLNIFAVIHYHVHIPNNHQILVVEHRHHQQVVGLRHQRLMKGHEKVCRTNFVFFVLIGFDFLDSTRSNSSITAPKSLREWHEQPVNLLEQPSLTEKANVQILSPNSDRVNLVFCFFLVI